MPGRIKPSATSRFLLSSVSLPLTCLSLPLTCLSLSLAFLSIFGIYALTTPSSHAEESSELTPVHLRLNSVINLAVNPDEVDLHIVPTTGLTYSENVTAVVSTNNITGYYLTMNTPTTTTALTRSGTSDSITSPSTLTGTTLGNNNWGYGTGANATAYLAIPSSTNLATLNNYNTNITGHTTTITIGAKADLTISAGTYTNTLIFTAITNPVPNPTITNISPNQGPLAGGTTITLTGTNLDHLLNLKIDGKTCMNLTRTNTTSATCITPEGTTTGAKDVTLENYNQDITMTNAFTYYQPETFKFSIDTRMTDTLDTDPTHYDGNATAFSIPTSGYVGGVYNHSYNWVVNCGGGQEDQIISGTGANNSAGIQCAYSEPNEYQVSITSNGAPTDGWMNAFGFSTGVSGTANTVANKILFKSIDTPIPANSRSANSTYRFARMFYGTKNAVSIPADLFSDIVTLGSTTFYNMFYYTFYNYAYNATTGSIPEGLLSTIDTTRSTLATDIYALRNVFYYTFYSSFYNSRNATIPPDLFATIDTGNYINLEGLFSSTFYRYAYNSEIATIPAGLFDALNTGTAQSLRGTFYRTFSQYGYSSTAGTIPANLFTKVDFSGTSNNQYINATAFGSTFLNYAFANKSNDDTPDTDINDIWGNANFAGKVRANNAGGHSSQTGGFEGIFYQTFLNMPSLTGSAQTFIDTYLGVNLIPDLSASTFYGTSVTDRSSLNINWK